MEIEETKGIRAVIILEVLGRPPEHLTEKLEELIGKIDAEPGARVLGKKINEPAPMKERDDFYTNFAEVEIEVNDVLELVRLMFKYMPANLEIISPELVVLTNNGWTEILSELIRKLHGYEEIARIIQVEKAVLEKKLREILETKKKSEEEEEKEE
jgi:hypothetical protein